LAILSNMTSRLKTFLLPACLAPLSLLPSQQTTAPHSKGSSGSSMTTLRFSWPIPARASIIEESLKRGRKAVTSYKFRLSPDPKNPARWIGRISDIKVLKMDTGKANAQQIALSKKILTAISSALPTLSIQASTLEAKTQGVQKGIDAVLKVLKENTKSPKEQKILQTIEKSMKSKAMLRNLQESSLFFWKAWAGVWNGLTLPAEGSSRSFKGVMYYPTGGQGSCKVTLTQLGSPKGKPQWIRLKYRQDSDSTALKQIVQTMKASIPAPYRDRFNEGLFESAKLSVTITATLDRKTLLPQRVLVEKDSEIKPKNRPASKRFERRDYRFHWEKD